MAFAQRQHLGALQEAPHALGVFLLVHLSTLSFAPPSCGGRKSGPSQEASCAAMGRDLNLATPDRGRAYSPQPYWAGPRPDHPPDQPKTPPPPPRPSFLRPPPPVP